MSRRVYPSPWARLWLANGLALAVLLADAAHAGAQSATPAARDADATRTARAIRRRFAARQTSASLVRLDMGGTLRYDPAPAAPGSAGPPSWSSVIPFLNAFQTFHESMHVIVHGEQVRVERTMDGWDPTDRRILKDRRFVEVQDGNRFTGWAVDDKRATVHSQTSIYSTVGGLDDALAFIQIQDLTRDPSAFTFKNLDDYRRGRTPWVTIEINHQTIYRGGWIGPMTKFEDHLDPTRDYVPVRRRGLAPDGSTASEAEIDYVADPRLGFVPSHVKVTKYGGGRPTATTDLDCSGFQFGGSSAPGAFQLNLPPEVKVEFEPIYL